MAVRNDFTAGEVLAAADLNDTFASKLPYSYGTATPSTSVDGFLWYDENDTPPTPKFWDGAAFQAIGGGTILQIVRATDISTRTTTSSTFVDASISVTITPQKSDSAVLLFFIGSSQAPDNSRTAFQITDNSNNAISGAEEMRHHTSATSPGPYVPMVMMGYATPATTSATTYKVRFRRLDAGTVSLYGAINTTQLFAIEVAA